jgi:hypothetical protein
MEINRKDKAGESGNVLFLILIAVALFAALSYAVTQSTRSGAGDTASETALISSAQLTQYPAGIRTSVVRMIIGGVAVEELLFNTPSDFNDHFFTSHAQAEANRRRLVFHPNGGNATYQRPPRDVVTDPATMWYFNATAQIQNIGMTGSGTDNSGNDVVAWLPNVTQGVCKRLNEEVGITGTIPTGQLARADIAINMKEPMDTNAWRTNSAGTVLHGGNAVSGALVGQPFGCFQDAGGIYIYYHVLIER